MITKVTKDNKALYQVLFEKVNDDLGFKNDEDKITSLDAFFANFEQIIGDEGSRRTVYTILPLDEPTFDIDANTRTITVPTDFKKNGISVQGDQVSEILYFTIDRYVDTIDLYRDDINIVIQWETAPSNGQVERGISLAYNKDITLFRTQGKMIFGWAVNNNITKNSGNIKFSVRFYKLNADKELDFSFSTLTATATINPGLDYTWGGDEFTNIYDDSKMILSRIKDSIQPVDGETAKEPVFLLPKYVLVSDEEKFTITVNDEDYSATDLDKNEESNELEKVFTTAAVSDDAGYISYYWTRTDLNDNITLPVDSTVAYIETEDKYYSGEYAYFEKTIEDGIVVMKPKDIGVGQAGELIPEEVLEAGLYERVTQCVATATGIYTVTAKNKRGQATSTSTLSVVIPGPDKDTFEVTLPEGQTEQVLLDASGSATVAVLGKTARVTEGNMVGDTIVYQFEDEAQREVVNTSDAVAQQYTVGPVDEAERAGYDHTVEVMVYATRNNEDTDIITQSFRVTDAAHAPIVQLPEQKTYAVYNTDSAKAIINVEVTNYDEIVHSGEGDSLTYQWFKVAMDGEGDMSDFSNDVAVEIECENCVIDHHTGSHQFVFQPKKTKIKGSDELAGAGAYYCVATNTVNGSSASNDVSNFTLNDCIVISITE